MKKLSVLIFALLMALGISSVASANSVTFDIDFYGHGDLQKGVMDTGDTITLMPCETVSVDLWAKNVPSLGVGGFGFGFGVLPGSEINFEITDYTIASPFSDFFGTSKIFPGGVAIEALLSPGTLEDGDFLMASLELHCIAPSIDDLYIYDYWDDSSQWVLKNVDGTTVLDNTILPQYLATVNQVPIPGAVWLLGCGLVGLGWLRRKMRG